MYASLGSIGALLQACAFLDGKIAKNCKTTMLTMRRQRQETSFSSRPCGETTTIEVPLGAASAHVLGSF